MGCFTDHNANTKFTTLFLFLAVVWLLWTDRRESRRTSENLDRKLYTCTHFPGTTVGHQRVLAKETWHAAA